MAETAAKPLPQFKKLLPENLPFKYPSEEETYVRRLGAACLSLWPELPEETRASLLAEAGRVWDREYHVYQLGQKLETFVRHHARKEPRGG